jgi:hypothetical protein
MALTMPQCLEMSHTIQPVRRCVVENDAAKREAVLGSMQEAIFLRTHPKHHCPLLLVIDPGHCFMTEDGGEIDNSFEANLGAATVAVVRLIRSSDTDASNPTTFWCSNPMNEWVGNVAAGSRSLGFWFELEESVRAPTLYLPSSNGMNPMKLTLKKFVNNSAHSNFFHGLRK